MGGWLAAGSARAADGGVVPDPSFRACLNSYLQQPADADVTADQLSGLTGTVTCDGGDRQERVTDLTGAQHLTGLTGLALNNNNIADLSPLAPLTGLTDLELLGNQVVSTQPLAALNALSTLDLRGNQVTDLSGLAQAAALTEFYADGNRLTDLTPLAGCTSLTTLWLAHNAITDLAPLAGLTQLKELSVEGNQVTRVTALAGLTGLRTLYLSDNRLTDLSPLPATLPVETCVGQVCASHIFAARQNAAWSVQEGTARLPLVQWSGSARALKATVDSGNATVDEASGLVTFPTAGEVKLSWLTTGANYFSGTLTVTVGGAPARDDTVAAAADDVAGPASASRGATPGSGLAGAGSSATLGHLLLSLFFCALGLATFAVRVWLFAAPAGRLTGATAGSPGRPASLWPDRR